MNNWHEETVKALLEGRLGLANIRAVVLDYVRLSSKTLPETKSILCGQGDAQSGLIHQVFQLLTGMIGGIELAVLRSKQADKKEQQE